MLLPVTDRPVDTPEPTPTATRSAPEGRTVLVVEDEDALREVTRRILGRCGYRVLTAAGGPEALALVQHLEHDIDLLITDVIMPTMLGKDVAAAIRASRPGIRVLYMSGYAYPVLTSQGTLDPGVHLLPKPFTEDALLDKVTEVLDPAPATPRPG
jgi:CheY-like chemotaxis protein